MVWCLSVSPSMGPQQQTHCCRFVAVDLVVRRYWSIAAAVVIECSQCHTVSVYRKLNAGVFLNVSEGVIWDQSAVLNRCICVCYYVFD